MEIYYQLLEKLRTIAEKSLTNHPEPKEEKAGLLLYAVGKADKTLCAIVLLCRNGMGEDALILCRSIFEICITVEYIFKDQTDYRAKRYFSYDWVQRKKMLGYISTVPHMKKYLTPDNLQIANDIKKNAKKVNMLYKYGSTWSDKSIYEMASDVGFLDLYQTAYRIQCNLSHSNPRSMNDYFKEENGHLIINSGPSDNLVQETLVTSFHSYYYILMKLNNYFKKGHDTELRVIEKEFIKASNTSI
ncbi:hypothetical protein A2303_03135 [Candidatus Falkowbacteria bacterium RIFOXYB2_FULL_47_14]|uniref:Uncharacterized protein n=1 Tax=Candidatus Falkowbacteria bacterium RIFOXYA2_FULL_47_19 TaxID=1797994 RepID=A0A1F5SEZ4_9BACT|nr:MAG: hypothetical protein A2227_07840 [Candidatus Falkowbacteria bacterium RIFOXYA2_FULL_47_19]OGF35183.1 MAG: hypothetical protein A2468_01970 [Candidatus Falkowbacteria bacterium RIFOXYC2_FULL_46_15]OGF43348.1 MAG: hypothetical protein A2303_03135 [Candidatus Falkowbacteria bacterium RIFOXYB2_FULL_47_14]